MWTQLFNRTCCGSALLAILGLIPGANTSAQTLSTGIGGGRTTNERIATETPPPVNTDPSRPELRSAAGAAASQNLDTAILIEHAVDMAIEGSTMALIAGPVPQNSDDLDAVKMLRNKAKKLMGESQTLLGQAAADGQRLAANPSVARFHSAANLYVTTLAGIEPSSPAEVAQLAMINQSVKDVLDADHIQQMSRMNTGSVALQQLKNHAALMKTQGTDLIRRMTPEGTSESSLPLNVSTLASRGQQLIAVAEELGRMVAVSSARMNSHSIDPGPNSPGRFQNNKAEIIGGTYGTGSPRLGVYQGLGHPLGATNPKAEPEPSTIPTYSPSTTGSTGGLRPQ
jgi:hypothetical protein